MMAKYIKNITIFFVLGIISFLIAILGFFISGMGEKNSMALVFYVALILFPISVLILVIDRICVWKFGAKIVNKIELYLVLGYIGTQILFLIVLLISGQL